MKRVFHFQLLVGEVCAFYDIRTGLLYRIFWSLQSARFLSQFGIG